jgi:DNA replication protein DnaC
VTMRCPTCNAELDEKLRAEEKAAAKRDRQRQIDRLFASSGIPVRFASRTFESFVADSPAKQRVRGLGERFTAGLGEVEHQGASLILCGRPGTGKTHLACACGHGAIEKLLVARFMTVAAALRYVKDSYRRDSDRSESQAIRDLLAPDLLILDEVGVQIGSEHEKMLMFEIINERYQNCRSTILISNLTKQEISDFLGDRVIDRFRESGAVVAFDWESYRGRRAA